jgi:hypothetical protein
MPIPDLDEGGPNINYCTNIYEKNWWIKNSAVELTPAQHAINLANLNFALNAANKVVSAHLRHHDHYENGADLNIPHLIRMGLKAAGFDENAAGADAPCMGEIKGHRVPLAVAYEYAVLGGTSTLVFNAQGVEMLHKAGVKSAVLEEAARRFESDKPRAQAL